MLSEIRWERGGGDIGQAQRVEANEALAAENEAIKVKKSRRSTSPAVDIPVEEIPAEEAPTADVDPDTSLADNESEVQP